MKISVIMQSFLGDYPGSRSLPKEKFLRAVNSFLTQEHVDKELIIIADGCEITKKMFELYYSNHDQIKFCYLHRDLNKEKSMYVVNHKITSFRGLPRQLGVEIATGDLIAYLDSDDIMLPKRLSDINLFWEKLPEDILWTSNPCKFVNEKALTSPHFREPKCWVNDKTISIKNEETGKFENFILHTLNPGSYSFSAYTICHRKKIKTKWLNTRETRDESGKRIEGISEDNTFVISLLREGKGLRQDSPTFVMCHYRNIWDT